MPEHKVGTREEWQAARDELAKLEAQHAELNEEIKRKRLELPWVPVEKEYEFDTEDGKKSLAELFDGRSQLLAYNIMYGPDYSIGACPGCTSLGDEFSGGLIHMNKRDVTFLCFSRAPIDRLAAYRPMTDELAKALDDAVERFRAEVFGMDAAKPAAAKPDAPPPASISSTPSPTAAAADAVNPDVVADPDDAKAAANNTETAATDDTEK